MSNSGSWDPKAPAGHLVDTSLTFCELDLLMAADAKWALGVRRRWAGHWKGVFCFLWVWHTLQPLLKRSIGWYMNLPRECPPTVRWGKASFTFYHRMDDKAGKFARTALWGIQTLRSSHGSSSTWWTYFQEMGLLRISLCGYNPFQNFCALFIFSVKSGSVGWIILNYAWLCFQIP